MKRFFFFICALFAFGVANADEYTVLCPVGYHIVDEHCEICPAGTYSMGGNVTE